MRTPTIRVGIVDVHVNDMTATRDYISRGLPHYCIHLNYNPIKQHFIRYFSPFPIFCDEIVVYCDLEVHQVNYCVILCTAEIVANKLHGSLVTLNVIPSSLSWQMKRNGDCAREIAFSECILNAISVPWEHLPQVNIEVNFHFYSFPILACCCFRLDFLRAFSLHLRCIRSLGFNHQQYLRLKYQKCSLDQGTITIDHNADSKVCVYLRFAMSFHGCGLSARSFKFGTGSCDHC